MSVFGLSLPRGLNPRESPHIWEDNPLMWEESPHKWEGSTCRKRRHTQGLNMGNQARTVILDVLNGLRTNYMRIVGLFLSNDGFEFLVDG